SRHKSPGPQCKTKAPGSAAHAREYALGLDQRSPPLHKRVSQDSAEKIIVGFGESGTHEHELQVFDNMIGGGMAFSRGGLGFVTSGDPEAKWEPAPGL
ncbi:hypothetical protein N8077_00610, partial [Myxococcota bacterium]|nr:hypothetical protein [Myxococcota bacterium]